MPAPRRLRTVLLSCILLCALPAPARAGIVARVDQASQRMRVYVDGVPTYDWPVSTARAGYRTPNGSYRVFRTERMWRSRKYGNALMPHALFFRGGYAVHGTDAVGRLGRRASHGCIRLSPSHARALFELTRARGGARIVIR